MQGAWISADVRAAWAQGWTGNGIKIGVLDDFTPEDDSAFLHIQHPTGCTVAVLPASTIKLCSDNATAAYRMTHGDQVAGIAGGAAATFTGKLSESGIYTEAASSGSYQGVTDITATFSSPYYGAAKDAQVIRGDFLSHQQSTNGLFAVLQDWGVGVDARSRLYQQVQVVNLSLSSGSSDATANQRLFDAQIGYASSSTTPDAVFVKAAGNFSCAASAAGCDPINQVLYQASAFKEKTLLVGALDAPGSRLASYSNMAGAYADRFVVADGRGIHSTQGGYVEGTSFAAPRVAGYAAIIAQKYPALSAAKIAKAVLDSAIWNPAWGEKTAATQAIYGQGEASLSRALALADTLR
jgi:subtilisin family serine protease